VSFPDNVVAGREYMASGPPIHGIKDGRGEFFQQEGLLNASRTTFVQPRNWTQ